MSFHPRVRLRFLLPLLLAGLTLLGSGLILWNRLPLELAEVRRAETSQLWALTHLVRNSLADLLVQGRTDLAARRIADLAGDPHLRSVAVLGPDGQVRCSSRADWVGRRADLLPGFQPSVAARSLAEGGDHLDPEGDHLLRGYFPVTLGADGRPGGLLFVTYDLSPELDARRAALRHKAAWLLGYQVVLALLLAALLDLLVSRKVDRLAETMLAVERGELGARSRMGGRTEVSGLGQGLDRLLDRLEEGRRELADQEELFRSALVHAATGLVLLDPQGRYLKVNPAFCRMLGYPEEELLATTMPAVTHPDDREADRENVRRMLARETVVGELDKRYLRKDGMVVYAHVSPAVVWNADGSPRFMISQIQDVTARVDAEAQLRDAHAFNQALLAAQPMGVLAYHAVSGQCVMANQGISKTIGATVEQALKQNFRQIESWKQSSLLETAERVLATGIPEYQEECLSSTFGKKVWLGCHLAAFTSGGEPHLLMVTTDISDRMRTEQLRFESERRLLALLGGVDQIAVMLDLEGRVTYCNDHLLSLTGWAREEVVGQDWFQRFIPENWEGVRQFFQDSIQTGQMDLHYENPIRTRSGEQRLVHWTNTVLMDAEGQAAGIASLGRDITDVRKAEEALRTSEAWYRGLFDHMQEGFAHCRIVMEDGKPVDWIYLEVNSAFQRLTGLPFTRGVSASRLVPGIHQVDPELLARYARVALGGLPEKFETYVAALDAWFAISVYSPAPGDFIAVFDVITERKHAESALRASEEKFARIFQSSPDGILILEAASGQILEANASLCRLLGFQAREVTGHTPGPEDLDVWVQAGDWDRLRETLRNHGQASGFRTDLRRPDGRAVKVLISTTFLKVGGTLCVLALVRDVTDQLQVEEERRLLEIQVQRAQKLESLGSLAGGVAHDMNNVLGAILGLASLHHEEPANSPAIRHALDVIIKACLRGRTLVQGLLGFARQGLAERQVLDLNTIICDEVALLERTTLQRVQLDLSLADGLRPVLGDPSALSHALMNLCVNAVDAMESGGTLTLATRNDGTKGIVLEVADTGSGMTREVIEKALDPFFTTKPQGKGTGLGLPIVYGTIKAHGGSLVLDSAPGRGTTVRIHLPACEPAAPAAPAAPEAPAPRRSLKVLVADDDELVRTSLDLMLRALQHETTVVGNGEEALSALEGGLEPDLVILDVNMPGLGGLETLPRLRALRPGIPVLLATGRVDQQALDFAQHHPGVSLLSKPFTLDEVKRRIGEAV